MGKPSCLWSLAGLIDPSCCRFCCLISEQGQDSHLWFPCLKADLIPKLCDVIQHPQHLLLDFKPSLSLNINHISVWKCNGEGEPSVPGECWHLWFSCGWSFPIPASVSLCCFHGLHPHPHTGTKGSAAPQWLVGQFVFCLSLCLKLEDSFHWLFILLFSLSCESQKASTPSVVFILLHY